MNISETIIKKKKSLFKNKKNIVVLTVNFSGNVDRVHDVFRIISK